MSDYISRDEAYQRLHDAGGCGATEEWAKGYDDGITEAIRIINEMPTADVAPVVHGHWKTVYREDGTKADKCSVCTDAVKYFDYKYGWCPHCGAKMYESEENENG